MTMEDGDVAVKRRTYRSAIRRERADRTRQAVIAAGRELFLRDGYAATTVAAIAEAASVSVETIYKSFGGKSGLLRTIWEHGLAGRGPVHAEDRSDALRDQSDPAAVIEGWGRLVAEVGPRAAPVILLVKNAAGADPEVAALHEKMEADRLERMTDNARHLIAGGGLAVGIGLTEVADILYTITAPELYELLVVRRGWTPERFSEFATTTMKATLLPAG